MLRLIGDIRDSGKTQVVVSSHLLRDVEQVCEEVVVLREGRIAVQCDLAAERRTDRKFLSVETAGEIVDSGLIRSKR